MSQTHQKPIRLGMVGGGRDSFIGAVHRIAARLDGQFELVAGALSSSPEKARMSGEALGLARDRVYDDFTQMAKREARLKNGIEAVAIVTPNNVHYRAAREFLKRGIHVICDKPMTSTLPDARKLVQLADRSAARFFLTHNYTAYPLIRQAREMVKGGQLGKIRVVQVEYAQDWLSVDTQNKQADWRMDPERSGAGGSIGDIGTHAFNLAEFVSGDGVESLAGDLQSFVSGRLLDDNAHVLLRFSSGARGMLWSSQVAPGNENGLMIRVFGERGGLVWRQENPNQLHWSPFGEPTRILTRAGAGTSETMADLTRLPPGHPEGYLEGFANLYKEIAAIIRNSGKDLNGISLIPDAHDGLRGMQFIEACVRSSNRNSAWVSIR